MTLDTDPEADPLLRITVSSDALHVSGELDAASCALLRDAIDAADAASGGPIRLDMSNVEFMDSAGIGVLIESFKSRAEGVIVVHPSPAVERILLLTGLYQRFVGPLDA